MIDRKRGLKALGHVESDVAISDKKKPKKAEGSQFKDRKTPKSDRKQTQFKQKSRKSSGDEAIKAEEKPKSSDIKSRLENTLKIAQNKRNAIETPSNTDVEATEKGDKAVSNQDKQPKKSKMSKRENKAHGESLVEQTNDIGKEGNNNKKRKHSVKATDKGKDDLNEGTDETNDTDKKISKKRERKHSKFEDDVTEDAGDKKVSKKKKRKKDTVIEEKDKSDEEVNQDETIDTDKKVRKKKKTTTEVQDKVEDDANQSEEEDPEKAAIRKKKREKRKQKKVEKELQKQREAERAGTAKISALEYLETWKNNKKEWKFNKVRQCWLLQHMYDQSLVDDEKFETILEYLEGCKGKAREVTVTDAENYIKSLNNDDDDDDKAKENDDDNNDEEAEEKKPEPIDEVKLDRAKQVIQLLSI